MPNIVLASGSPRRKQLLEWAEIDFRVVTRDTAETWPPGLPIAEVPVHIARNKGLAVQAAFGGTAGMAHAGDAGDAGDSDDQGDADDPGDPADAAVPKKSERAGLPVIIAADTVVVLDGEIIGKPRDHEDAVAILSRLAGRRHEVITGVAILQGRREMKFADSTSVWFHDLTPAEIARYVERYHPFDKAGAYAIQEWIGVVGIRRIEGDFYNVMGLPVSRVVRALREL